MPINDTTKNFRKEHRIDIIFLLYWGIMIFWQNINPGKTGTLIDTIIKTFLLLFLVVYYFTHTRNNNKHILLFSLLACNMLLSLCIEFSLSIRILLNYIYPVLIIFLFFILGGNYQITKSQLIRFSNGIICIVLYAALYAVILMPDKFANAFQINNAYGYELSSFFISSHEYALYLMGGIVSCMLCLELNQSLTKVRKLFYIICMGLFGINLILTYSRTILVGTICIFFVNALLNKKSKLAKFTWLGMFLVIVLILFVPKINHFVFNIILKGNNLAGRDDLAVLAIRTFKNAPLIEKIWGQGVTKIQTIFRFTTHHTSVHNAYLQIILYFGISNLIFIVSFLLVCLKKVIKSIKKNRVVGGLCTALNISCIIIMLFNTATVFTSSVDSFFLTIFMVIMPYYVSNAINAGTFDDTEE